MADDKKKKTTKRGMRFDPVEPVTVRQKKAAKPGKSTKPRKTIQQPAPTRRQRTQAAAKAARQTARTSY